MKFVGPAAEDDDSGAGFVFSNLSTGEEETYDESMLDPNLTPYLRRTHVRPLQSSSLAVRSLPENCVR
jgi:hypothetical protein